MLTVHLVGDPPDLKRYAAGRHPGLKLLQHPDEMLRCSPGYFLKIPENPLPLKNISLDASLQPVR